MSQQHVEIVRQAYELEGELVAAGIAGSAELLLAEATDAVLDHVK